MKAPRICSPASRLLFSCRSSVKFRSAFPSSAPTFDSLVFPFFSFSYAFPECFSPFPPSPSVFSFPFFFLDSYFSYFLSFSAFLKRRLLSSFSKSYFSFPSPSPKPSFPISLFFSETVFFDFSPPRFLIPFPTSARFLPSFSQTTLLTTKKHTAKIFRVFFL